MWRRSGEPLMPIFVCFGILFALAVLCLGASRSREHDLVERAAQLEHLRRAEGGCTIDGAGVSGAFGFIWGKPGSDGVISVYFHATAEEGHRSTRFVFRTFGGDVLPRFEVYSTSLSSDIAKLFGMEDIEVGDQALDSAYILKAPSPTWMRAFMTEDVRGAFKRLAMRYEDHVSVSSFGDTLELRVGRWLDGFELTQLFTMGELLVRELVPGTAPAAPAAAQRPVVSEPSGILVLLPPTAHCLVCGDALAGRPLVCCRRCDTPHHRDCWRYNGSCAVYGCIEVQALVEAS